VTDLKAGAKQVRRYGAHIDNLESDYQRFSGTLDRFLSRIRIDDGLRLVPDRRRIASASREDLDIEIGPDDCLLADMRAPAELFSEPEDGEPMVIDDDDYESSSQKDPRTATTPSDLATNLRMQVPEVRTVASRPSEPSEGVQDSEMPPPLLPPPPSPAPCCQPHPPNTRNIARSSTACFTKPGASTTCPHVGGELCYLGRGNWQSSFGRASFSIPQVFHRAHPPSWHDIVWLIC
jgi:hypothetical protein